MAQFPNRYEMHKRPHPGESFDITEDATHQEFKDECDINRIMKKYNGVVPGAVAPPSFVDVSNVGDFLAVNIKMKEVEEDFMSLPATVRERFKNSPIALLEFVSDKANRDEAIKLGLVNAPPPVKGEEGKKEGA